LVINVKIEEMIKGTTNLSQIFTI